MGQEAYVVLHSMVGDAMAGQVVSFWDNVDTERLLRTGAIRKATDEERAARGVIMENSTPSQHQYAAMHGGKLPTLDAQTPTTVSTGAVPFVSGPTHLTPDVNFPVDTVPVQAEDAPAEDAPAEDALLAPPAENEAEGAAFVDQTPKRVGRPPKIA